MFKLQRVGELVIIVPNRFFIMSLSYSAIDLMYKSCFCLPKNFDTDGFQNFSVQYIKQCTPRSILTLLLTLWGF